MVGIQTIFDHMGRKRKRKGRKNGQLNRDASAVCAMHEDMGNETNAM